MAGSSSCAERALRQERRALRSGPSRLTSVRTRGGGPRPRRAREGPRRGTSTPPTSSRTFNPNQSSRDPPCRPSSRGLGVELRAGYGLIDVPDGVRIIDDRYDAIQVFGDAPARKTQRRGAPSQPSRCRSAAETSILAARSATPGASRARWRRIRDAVPEQSNSAHQRTRSCARPRGAASPRGGRGRRCEIHGGMTETIGNWRLKVRRKAVVKSATSSAGMARPCAGHETGGSVPERAPSRAPPSRTMSRALVDPRMDDPFLAVRGETVEPRRTGVERLRVQSQVPGDRVGPRGRSLRGGEGRRPLRAETGAASRASAPGRKTDFVAAMPRVLLARRGVPLRMSARWTGSIPSVTEATGVETRSGQLALARPRDDRAARKGSRRISSGCSAAFTRARAALRERLSHRPGARGGPATARTRA